MGVKAGAFGGTAEDKKDSKAERAARRSSGKATGNGTGAKASARKSTAKKTTSAAKKSGAKPAAKKQTAKKVSAASRKKNPDKGFHVLEQYENAAQLVEAGYDGPVFVDLGVYDETTGSRAVDALVDDATKAQEGVPRDGDFVPVSARTFKVEKVRHEEVAPRRYRA